VRVNFRELTVTSAIAAPGPGQLYYQQAVITYNSLVTTSECHEPEYTFWDIMGVSGGAIGIVMAATLILIELAKWIVKKTGVGEEQNSRGEYTQQEDPEAHFTALK
jgi:hypothetical protein